MSPLPEAQARLHPAYLGSLHTAACRAVVHRNDSFAVHLDGEAIFVQNADAPPPTNAALVCTAKHWHGITVQVSFSGARFEWIDVTLQEAKGAQPI
jgi:hypothetical protein